MDNESTPDQTPETETPARRRGPGRPPLPEGAARTASVTASVTPAERARLKAKSKEVGRPLAAMVRDAIMLLLACFALAFSSGCGSAQHGPSARDTQIVAISVTGSILGMVAHEIGALAQADADHTCGTVSSAETEACVASVEARWAPADAAIDTAHEALDAWLGGVDADPVRAVQATIDAYESMGTALSGFGVKVPPLPEEVKIALLALAGAGSEIMHALEHDAGTDAAQ